MHPSPDHQQSPRPARAMGMALALVVVFLMVRLPGLMGMPVFGDEAIYLRWAQCIRGDGGVGSHPWISLIDPKPPLHFWLLATVIGWGSDPLLPARLLSVLAGAACIPLMLAAGSELARLVQWNKDQPPSRMLGLIGAVLAIFCPFLAFYQRLATADALFVSESVAIVWLSLRWGRLVCDAPRRAWSAASWLGIAIGAGLLTRQGVSYTLCIMPAAGFALHALQKKRSRDRQGAVGTGETFTTTPAAPPRRPWPMALVQLLLAALIAGALWSPYLFAQLPERAADLQGITAPAKLDLLREIKRRIFYQDQFTAAPSASQRLKTADHNAALMFLPAWNGDHVPVSGWFFLYLTPLVYLTCLAGLVDMAIRAPRLFIFVLIWLLAVLAPMIVLANVIYSRYVLAGAIPLLFAAAFLIGDLLRLILARTADRPGLLWTAGLLLWALLLLWPMKELASQATFWWRQTLTARDQYQYLTGWTAGFSADQAIARISQWAQVGPVVVITDNGWGTPSDAVWADLIGKPNIHLFYADDLSTLAAKGPDGEILLKDEKWLYPPAKTVRLAGFARSAALAKSESPEPPAKVPVLVVTRGVFHDTGDTYTELPKINPNLVPEKAFNGLELRPGQTGESVVIFALKWGSPDQGPEGP